MSESREMTESRQTGRVPDPQVLLELHRINERSRVIRTIVVCGTVVIGIGCVTYGFVSVYAKPNWIDVLIVVLLSMFAPSPVMLVILRTRRKLLDKAHRRTVELERRLDPDRSSSHR